MGQILAVVLHVLTWKLRRAAIGILAVLGVMGALGTALVVLLLLADTQRQFTGLQTIGETCLLAGFVLVPLIFPPLIGFSHALQLRSGWRHKHSLWILATLSVYGELLLAMIVTVIGQNYAVRGMADGFLYAGSAFWVTLLVLMVFRPLILKLLNAVVPMVRRVVERGPNSL